MIWKNTHIFKFTNVLFLIVVGSCFMVTVYWKERNLCMKQLPSVLVIGAPKCGTAALSAFLSYNPNIAIDRSRELNFFSDNYELGLDWYMKQLPCSMPGQVVIERSSNYIRIDKDVVTRVWRMNPEMKLILTVCEPVRRIISHYAMRLERDKIVKNVSFEDALFPSEKGKPSFLVRNSNFSNIFAAWLRLFPLGNFHIVDGDNLKSKPWEEVLAIERFLELQQYCNENRFVYNASKGFYCFRNEETDAPECLTSSKGRKHPDISENTRLLLREYFQSYNELFYKQCGQNFSW